MLRPAQLSLEPLAKPGAEHRFISLILRGTPVYFTYTLSLGLLVSSLARTEGQIFPTIPLIAVPSVLLSGLVIPHDSLPTWLQGLSYAIPLTYAERVLLGLLRDGKSFADLAGSFALLATYGAGALFVASLTLREVE